MSRGLVPFTVPNERSALQAGNVGGNADSFRPMAEHGSGRFFIIRGRCHTGICRQALRRHLRTGVIQVSSGRRYAGICGRCCASIFRQALRRHLRQVLRQYLQAGVTQASAGSRCASVYMQVLRKYLQQGVAQVLQVMSMKLNDIRQEVAYDRY